MIYMSILKEKQLALLFIFVDIVYLTQGVVAQLGFIYKLFLFLVLGISVFYFFKVNIYYRDSKFIKALNLFVVLLTIYGIIHIFEPLDATLRYAEGYRPYTYITNAYRPMLQIYPLYYFSRKGFIDEEAIRRWIIPSFLVAIITFYVKRVDIIAESMTGEVSQSNNVGYLITSLLPLLFFVKKEIYKYILLALIIIFVFLSAKRGAIFVAAVCIVWFLVYELRIASRKEKLLIFILIGISGLILFRYLSGIFKESEYMQYVLYKTTQGNTSGRDLLFSKAWNQFANGSLFTIIFGHGADSTYHLVGNRTHNDWLELLVNQGLLGVIVFLSFWLKIFKYWISLKKMNSYIYFILGSTLILFFSKTVFSMFYNDLSPIACLPFVWCIASVDINSKK